MGDSPPAALTVTPDVVAAMLAHARQAMPNEACGLLSGDLTSGTTRAFHPARNELASPYRYSIDAHDLVRITYAIEAAGESLVAIFHSHPRSVAEPSPSDIREARYPDAVHVLAGADSELRAWRINGGGVAEIPLRVAAAAPR
jgi:[CysO sulfur-carrier protein]-S-L-cysteine hydrolase